MFELLGLGGGWSRVEEASSKLRWLLRISSRVLVESWVEVGWRWLTCNNW